MRIPLLAVLLTTFLSGCLFLGNSKAPIPKAFVPALDQSGDRILIIVLSGMFSDEESLKQHGLHTVIQKSWPDADVLLTAARLPYYSEGVLTQRLHDEIIKPARDERYDQVWLAGGSMGGLGALMYEREYPGQVTGIVLLAPRLGNGELIDEIHRSGGIGAWNPGPLPAEMNGDNYERQVWKMIKLRGKQRDFLHRVWLICGTEDRMLPGARLLAPQLLPSQYIERPGGHDWDFWVSATEQIFARIRAAQT